MRIYNSLLCKVGARIIRTFRLYQVNWIDNDILECYAPVKLNIEQVLDVVFTFYEIVDGKMYKSHKKWAADNIKVPYPNLNICFNEFDSKRLMECIKSLPLHTRCKLICDYTIGYKKITDICYRSLLLSFDIYINMNELDDFNQGKTVGGYFVSDKSKWDITDMVKVTVNPSEVTWAENDCCFVKQIISK